MDKGTQGTCRDPQNGLQRIYTSVHRANVCASSLPQVLPHPCCLRDSGKTPPPATVKLDFDRNLRKRDRDLTPHFLWVINYAKRSITRGLPCRASQVGRKSGLIKAVSSVGRAVQRIHIHQVQGLSWQLLQREEDWRYLQRTAQACLALVSTTVRFKIW